MRVAYFELSRTETLEIVTGHSGEVLNVYLHKTVETSTRLQQVQGRGAK